MQNPSILKPIRIPTGAAILLAVMYFAASFIVPVLQAYFLATLLSPIYNRLKQRRVPGGLSLRRMKAGFGTDHFLPKSMVILSGMMVNYFALRALVNLVTATVTGLMLWFFGVDYAGTWAVLIFFLGFIPYIGAILAMIPPVLLAYAESGLGIAIVIVLLSLVINGAAENIVAPMVMGKGLAISPTVIFCFIHLLDVYPGRARCFVGCAADHGGDPIHEQLRGDAQLCCVAGDNF